MSTVITTSIHIFVALLTTTAALIMLIYDLRNKKARAVAAFLFLLALSSYAFGFELNAITYQQVLPWIVVEFFVAYATPSATFLTSLYLLLPNLAKKKWLTIPFWIILFVPLAISIFDLSGLSNFILGTHMAFDVPQIAESYLGGYMPMNQAASGQVYELMRFDLIGIFFFTMLFPLLFTAIKDRKSNPQNSINALIILAVVIMTAVVQIVLPDNFSETIPSLIANVLFAISFFIVGYRTISVETGQPAKLQTLLQNHRMGVKLALAIAVMILPTIVFIGFSTYSFFQNSLLTVSNRNLSEITTREGKLLITVFDDNFSHLSSLKESARLRTLLANRLNNYAGLTQEQISSQIATRNQQWLDGNSLLISAVMDQVNSPDIRRILEEFPEFTNIIIADQNGALVSAGKNPGQYDFMHSDWWNYVSITKSNFVGPVEYDEHSQVFYTTLAFPILDDEQRIIGGVLGTFNLHNVLTNIKSSIVEDVTVGIVTSDNELIPIQTPVIYQPIQLPPNAHLIAQPDQTRSTLQLNEKSQLLKISSLISAKNEYTVPWQIAAYQPADLALAPLNTARNGTILTSLLIISFSTIVVTVLTRSITQPLSDLTSAAEKILQGEREISLNITSQDEIGTLSTTFNQMVTEISQMVDNLEMTIDERTTDLERRALQLEASALVAQQANEIQDISTLLDSTVDLISEKFGYYHTGIFLLDEQRKYAVLEAANSEGGKRMLARGHKLQVGRVGVVGYCAGMGQPRIAQDVGADIAYYDNPDMPHTRSEMALPMNTGDRVIGVIDVQSTQASAFSQEDIAILQVLANQVALAIQKARLLETSQKALEELQRLYGEEASLAWRQKLTGEAITYQYTSTGFTKLVQDNQTKIEAAGTPLSKEIVYRGQVIGSLDFIRDELEGKWTDEEETLIEGILEQTALALENARLVDQIKLRSDQITLLQKITAMAASTLDETELLNNVVSELQSSLKLDNCGVIFFDTLNKTSVLAASAPESSENAQALEIPLDEDPYLQQGEQNSRETFAINELQSSSKYKTFTHTFNIEESNSLTIMPLTFREQAIGYIYMAEQEPDRQIDAEEKNLFAQLEAQISTAVESARLFAAEQQGREASAALLEITQISSASLDINEVLNEATYRSAEAIQANRCTILLLDEREKIKPLISVYYDGTQMEEEEWDMLERSIRTTYENVPLRTLAASLRTPRYIDSPLTYESFPLGWTHHFDIEKILMVPLISQNKVIGTMLYDLTTREKSFHQNQIELAQTIAGQIATTLENANLFDQAVRRAERERQVTEITAKIRASNDPKQILDTAISELRMALAKHEIQEKQKATSTKRKTSVSNGKDEL